MSVGVKRLVILCLLLTFSLPIPEARAAGGAHIVDDAEVETPGTCHLEVWATRFVPGDGYFNLAPACTDKRVPWLEIGVAYQHYWDQVIAAPLFGPAMKVNFQSDPKGISVGLGLNAGVNLITGNLGASSLLALVTMPAGDKVRLNFNAGWSYLRTEQHPNALFYGAQIEVDVGWDVSLMLEAFGRAPNGLVGSQLGLRYTPRIGGHEGWFDFDVLVGNFFDATSTRFITLGVTVRY